MERKVLTRADFDELAKTGIDLDTEHIHVPEWATKGVDPETVYVCIRTISGAERDQYENSLTVQRGKNRELNLANARAKLVALCMIDPATNKPIYASGEVHLLGQRSAKALDRLFEACKRLNGIGEEDVEALTNELKNEESGYSGSG